MDAKQQNHIVFNVFFQYVGFLIIQCLAENQRLIFDEKMNNQKSVKNKKIMKKL